ncbi:MAG: hypothetical protein Q4A05_09630 [Ruminococcus sp.]|nr:hypothetical protein [Ruminococcus sp.]
MKKRINIEYAVNAVISGLLTVAGLIVTVIGSCGIAELSAEMDKTMGSSTSDLGTIINTLFVGPLIGIAMGIVFILMIILGIIPAGVGIITASLSSVARFTYTEGGTTVTKGYKALMIANYCVMGAFTLIYAAGGLLLTLGTFIENLN